MRATTALSAAFACFALAATGCKKPPAACDDVSARAALTSLETASEKKYARSAVQKAKDAVEAARAAVEAEAARFALLRNYDDAATLCEAATQLTTTAAADVEAAKKRRAEVEALRTGSNAALDDGGSQLIAGRALLAAVPQPALDEKLRAIAAVHRDAGNDTNTALAQQELTGWVDDTASLSATKKTAEDAVKNASEIVLEIRRGAAAQCQPLDKSTPLVFGTRARAHEGFALVEAGPSEDNAQGFLAVLRRMPDGSCRTLLVRPAADALTPSLEPGVQLRTWTPGADARVFFVWRERIALFVKDDGHSWAFDAGEVAGFDGVCAAVTCTDPAVTGPRVDASCTCAAPKDPKMVDPTRPVNFSWRGNAVVAAR
jgi:hypothetical protein